MDRKTALALAFSVVLSSASPSAAQTPILGFGLSAGSRGLHGGKGYFPNTPYAAPSIYTNGYFSHRYPYDPIYYANPRGYYYYPPTGTVPQYSNIGIFVIVVPVPAAPVFCDGQEMTSMGTTRQFQSPPLDPGYQYTMAVRAVWEENGKKVEQTRTVSFQPGQNVRVDFTAPALAQSP